MASKKRKNNGKTSKSRVKRGSANTTKKPKKQQTKKEKALLAKLRRLEKRYEKLESAAKAIAVSKRRSKAQLNRYILYRTQGGELTPRRRGKVLKTTFNKWRAYEDAIRLATDEQKISTILGEIADLEGISLRQAYTDFFYSPRTNEWSENG